MDTALLLSSIVGLGIAAQWLAWYLKQPSILFLLLIGLIIGPVLGYFNPDDVLGDLLFPFISLGVAIILFEGSLTLEFDEIRQHGTVVQNLVSIGTIITIIVVGLSTYTLFDIDPLIALLFGSLVCVTGPTVIVPLLRSVRPNKTISNILKWEGIIIDPIGAIAVVLVYEYIVSEGNANGFVLFIEIVAIATLIGLFGAWLLSYLIKRHLIPEYLMNVCTLALVIVLFSISNHLEHESGLLAVTVMGVALANLKDFPKEDILEFNESLTVLLISVLFIVLAARVELQSLANIGITGIILLVIVMFIVRPIAVFVSSYGSSLELNEKLMISWIGPRGIVAAAISSLFAIKLQDSGMEGVELLVPLVFLIIIGTVLIQGLGAKLVASLLGVREPANNGVLIIGSNVVSIKVAKALTNQGIDVMIADASYPSIATARMQGIRCYYGNPMSERAYNHLDLLGIGRLFTMSMDREVNNLAEMYYRHEFGSRHIFRLKLQADDNIDKDNKKIVNSQWLFGKDKTYTLLARMIEHNARIKATKITENYTYHQYKQDNQFFVPLYTIDKQGVIHAITNASTVPKDCKLVALVSHEALPADNMIADLSDVQPDNHFQTLDIKSAIDTSAKHTGISDNSPMHSPMYSPVHSHPPSKQTDSDPQKTDKKPLKGLHKPLEEGQTTKVLNPIKKTSTETENSSKKPTKPISDASQKTVGKQVISNKAYELDSTSGSQATQSHLNGNGQAPKNEDGRLDAKRLPDSSE